MKFLFLVTILFLDCSRGRSKYVYPAFQTVVEGDKLFIRCKSFEKEKVAWTLNMESVPDSKVTDGSILIKEAALSDGGRYQCEGVNKIGAKFLATAEVEVIELRKNGIFPEMQGAHLGQTAAFTCNTDSPPVWSFKGKRLPFNVKRRGDKIYINSFKRKNEGQYECRGTYGSRENEMVKFAARGTLKIYKQDFIFPVKQRVRVGEYASIICRASDGIKWKHNGKNKIPSNTDQIDAVLVIESVIPQNHGVYECSGRSHTVGDFIASSRLVVVEDDQSKIYPPVLAVNMKDRVKLSCESDAKVTWKFNYGKLPNNVVRKHKPGTNNYMLIVKSAKSWHSGAYICEGEDEFNKRGFIAISNLTVSAKPSKAYNFITQKMTTVLSLFTLSLLLLHY